MFETFKKYCLLVSIFSSIILPHCLRSQTNLTGLHVAGLPNFSYKDGEGYAFGGGLFLYQYGAGDKTPYDWNGILGFKMSTEGAISSYLFLDMPQIWGAHRRLTIYAEYKSYLVDDYYGCGNNSIINKNYLDDNNNEYRNNYYYSYKHRWPAIYITFYLPFLSENISQLFALGFYTRKIETYPLPNKLAADQPPGIEGGRTNLFQYGLVYDTRDNEAVPTRGLWSELLFELVTPLLGSDYKYTRFTFTDRRYFAIFSNLVWAQRFVYEPIYGDVPFYDMTTINGSYERHIGLGGSSSLRGVPRLLFIGQHKLLANFELRYRVIKMTILKQPLTFYFHTFLDAGKVWLKQEKPGFDNIHFSYGIGLHTLWKKDLVGAIDIGRSKYSDYAFYISFRNLF